MSLGLNASLYMGARSLLNQRVGIEVSGHNIANASTPNAARQRVNISTDIAVKMDVGQQGTGSLVKGIEALRSSLLDDQVVRQSSLTGFYDKQSTLMYFLQDALGESLSTAESGAIEGIQSSTGIQNSLNKFFDSWQALESDPTSLILRNDVLSKASILTNDIKGAYNRILDLKDSYFDDATSIASEVNSLTEQIALLNTKISNIEVASDDTANDLRDQRQQAIEDLSKLVNITVTNTVSDSDSLIDIALEDAPAIVLVNASDAAGAGTTSRLDIVALNPTAAGESVDVNNQFNRTTNSAMRIVATNATAAPAFVAGNPIPGGSTVITPTEGELGAVLGVSNNVIGSNHEPPASGGFIATPVGSLVYELNTFATNLVTLLNGQHAGGTTWDLDGNNGGNFFTAGTNANNLSVAITDPRDIAAASGAADPGTLNSDNVRNITNLRDNANLGVAYRETVANFGTDVQQSERNLAAQELIQEQVLKRRESYSGISVDEEMTNLIVFQRAFEASARFITIIDEMYQQVVNMVR